MDHPEIVDFINWKVREEKKAHALIAGGYSSDFNGDAYHTISGQNSNNSVRVSDAFMRAAMNGGTWDTIARTTGEIVETYTAKDLWRQLAEAAWGCADPGVQYDTTINRWHTCPNTGRINASNPCSEYMFLDDSACNLSSLNLTKFLREDGSFDVDGYRHAIRVFFVAQEILVDFSAYPTKPIAKNSHDYRPLGLGYANLGTLLMLLGVPYDSDAGRSDRGGAHRHPLRARLQGLRRDGRGQGPLQRLRQEPRADAPGDGHAPRRGLRHRSRQLPRGALPRRLRRLGRRRRARPRARLPQRAGDRARAHRHHRPAHGLRHHRHRARLLPGEVQEARGRRLLQDRQPVRAGGAAPPRLRAGRGAGDRRLRLRHQHAPRRAARQPRHPQAEGPRQRGPRQDRGGAPGRLRSGARLRPLGPRRRGLRPARRLHGAAQPHGLLAAQAPRLHAPPRSRRRTRPSSAG